MARSGKGARRAMPSTPAPRPAERVDGSSTALPDGSSPLDASGRASSTGSAPGGSTPAGEAQVASAPGGLAPGGTGPRPAERAASADPHLIAGTGCVAGHDGGRELDAAPPGSVPTRRAARIGIFLAIWCAIGIGLVVDGGWLTLVLLFLVLWLLSNALRQRQAGHRGRCWRTRTWRHAWGRLAPSGDRR